MSPARFATRTLRPALVAAVLLAGLAASAVTWAAGPSLDPARAGPCVEDPKIMRRLHMEFLKHDRDDTVRRGVRPVKHSLSGCVDCHANAKDDRVLGSERHFCQGCHTYAAVKLDCFDCHASTARPARTASAAVKGAAR
jgi:hypothetical protein